MTVETIKVVTDNEQGFKIINKDDFDPKADKEFTGKKAPVKRTRKTAKDK